MKPECERCGKSGHGIEFNIFGPFEFGKYCVLCEMVLTVFWTPSRGG